MPFAYDKFTKRFVDDLNQAYKYFAIVVGRLILHATIQVGGLIVRASHAKKGLYSRRYALGHRSH